jgi:NAD(P)-dependent dehydrogenase (short-subunit alcohol dehydrogenase family)
VRWEGRHLAAFFVSECPLQYNTCMHTFPLALVTGAAHRLGKAFALSLARQGYALALHYRSSREKADSTAAEIRSLGVPVLPLGADLIREEDIRELFEAIDQSRRENPALRPLSLLVNSAAIMSRASAHTISASEVDAALGLNLRAPFLLAQAAFARMEEGGLIVNISDVGAQKAWSGFPAYTISKAGLDSLTRVLARSFAPRVRVNAIAPGLVLPADSMPGGEWQRLVARIPLGRAARLDEMTATLEFLIKNEYITGQTLIIDGGYSLL